MSTVRCETSTPQTSKPASSEADGGWKANIAKANNSNSQVPFSNFLGEHRSNVHDTVPRLFPIEDNGLSPALPIHIFDLLIGTKLCEYRA